jgi:hypothetical protein
MACATVAFSKGSGTEWNEHKEIAAVSAVAITRIRDLVITENSDWLITEERYAGSNFPAGLNNKKNFKRCFTQ